jgi:hypothetical protein
MTIRLIESLVNRGCRGNGPHLGAMLCRSPCGGFVSPILGWRRARSRFGELSRGKREFRRHAEFVVLPFLERREADSDLLRNLRLGQFQVQSSLADAVAEGSYLLGWKVPLPRFRAFLADFDMAKGVQNPPLPPAFFIFMNGRVAHEAVARFRGVGEPVNRGCECDGRQGAVQKIGTPAAALPAQERTIAVGMRCCAS